MTKYVKSTNGIFWRQDVFMHFHASDDGVLAKFTDAAGDYIEVSFAVAEWTKPRDLAATVSPRGRS